MKKLLCLVLSVIMIFSSSAIAFAAEDVTPVIVVSGMGAYPLVNEDGTNAFPVEGGVIAENVFSLLPFAVGSMLTDDFSLFNNNGMKYIANIFEPIACDENGNSVRNVTNKDFPGTAANHKEELSKKESNEAHMVCKIANEIGWDNTYYMYYDWRKSPLDIADKLKGVVDEALAKSETGKVSLYAISFGGMVTASYIYKYGTENIKNIVFSSTAFQGVEMVGEIFANRIDLNVEDAIGFLTNLVVEYPFIAGILGFSQEALEKYGKYSSHLVNAYLQHIEDEISLDLFKNVFADTFAHFKGMWAMIPYEFYDEAKTFMKANCNISDSFLESADEYMYNVQLSLENLFTKAENAGTSVYVTGAYGYNEIPVTEGKSNQCDDLIDSYLMTAGGTFAPYGEILDGDDYRRNVVCYTHNHKSTDEIADLSTCMRPEQTWVVKGMKHVDLQDYNETSDLALWLVTSEERLDVFTDSRYPQFVELDRKTGKFVSLTEGVTLSEKSTLDFTSFFDVLMKFLQLLMDKILFFK